MLILTRKAGESLYIGHDVKVTIVEVKGNQVRVGIAAPADLKVYREEIYRQILEENQKAAAFSASDFESIAASLPPRVESQKKVGTHSLLVAQNPTARKKS